MGVNEEDLPEVRYRCRRDPGKILCCGIFIMYRFYWGSPKCFFVTNPQHIMVSGRRAQNRKGFVRDPPNK